MRQIHTLYLWTVGASAALLANCSSVHYRYVPDSPQNYSKQLGTKNITTNINPTYFDLEVSGKIGSYFIFSESQTKAAELESVTVDLKDEKTGAELKISRKDLTVSFWNGKNKVEIKKQNYAAPLNALLPAELQQGPYRDMHTVTYAYDFEYAAPELPETVVQTISIRFQDRTVQLKTLLRKKRFEKPFISGRPFG